ncbi:PREDICTED: protein hairy-like [Acromyrmex echinatior]|uniref:Protein deadpan n=1 Tax=Acromyrmex echinatior TaxID=103372 RepID=F4X5A8_ACREC|nr:PREDICTED: protein hairy-like [Acromyrmex echinatior]EGI58356.1 Protein deadpan [Acromyrmex echinatior]
MLGSEEELEPQTHSGMTKAELRRSNKPIMEKRRRARINQYLDELKNFILVSEKDPTRHSKLEKADILEMTVKHIQTMQRQQLSTAVANDPVVLTKFRSGFSECATEVSRYINRLENVDPAIKQRLVSHLNNCVSHLQQMAPFYSQYVPYMPERLYPEVKVGFQSDFQNGDENNNGSARIQIPNGVQLIPSRLPTGELAFLVPQSAGISANFPFFPPATDTSTRIGQSSAFTAVHRPHTPLLSPSTSTSSYGDESHHSEHPRATTPNHHQPQHRFKLPEQSSASSKSFSSSPETQKPQISSTSDRKSPATAFLESKAVDNNVANKKDVAEGLDNATHTNGTVMHGLRQPLSVITDKTYNRASSGLLLKRDGLRRRHSDGLLAISDKRPRYQEPTSSTSSMNNTDVLKSTNEQSPAISTQDLPGSQNCQTPRNYNSNSDKFPASPSGSFATNGDMWRPW